MALNIDDVVRMVKGLFRLARIVGSTDDTQTFPVQGIEYLGKNSDAVIWFPYGCHANLPSNVLAVIGQLNGDPEERYAFPSSPRERQDSALPNPLLEGEILWFNPASKAYIYMKADGSIDVSTPKNLTINVAGNALVDVEGNLTADIEGNTAIDTAGNLVAAVGGDLDVDVAGISTIDSTGKITVTGNTDFVGNVDITGKLTQTGDAEIALTGRLDVHATGGSKVTFKAAGHDSNGPSSGFDNMSVGGSTS